jgi:hypothetical protein
VSPVLVLSLVATVGLLVLFVWAAWRWRQPRTVHFFAAHALLNGTLVYVRLAEDSHILVLLHVLLAAYAIAECRTYAADPVHAC